VEGVDPGVVKIAVVDVVLVVVLLELGLV